MPVCSIWLIDDRISYEVVEIEPGGQSSIGIFRAWAIDLMPIPKTGQVLPHSALARMSANYVFLSGKAQELSRNVYFVEFEKSGTQPVEAEKEVCTG